MEKTSCAFCHAECSLRNIKIKGDRKNPYYICFDCYKKTGIDDFTKISGMTVDSIKPYIDEAALSEKRSKIFRANEYVPGLIEADSRLQYWRLSGRALTDDSTVLLFSDIKSFSVEINGDVIDYETVVKRLKSGKHIIAEKAPEPKGIFRVPKCESLCINIKSDSLTAENISLPIIKKTVGFSSSEFKNALNYADECAAFLQSMTERASVGKSDDEEQFD